MANGDRVEIGERIGRFVVVGELGRGGMGSVYVGLDEKLDRKVALKVIQPEQRLDTDRKARFLREARVLSSLDHPNVCKFHDFIEEEDRDCLVLELVEGRSLRDGLDGGLDDLDKMAVARQLLGVLVAVHGQGLIHRDLKPENIMLTPDGGIKVLDFGLARAVRDPDSLTGAFRPVTPDRGDGGEDMHAGLEAAASVTVQGTVMGTLGYMSPEVARGEPATAASDMYSAGLMLHEVLTGQRPIPNDLPSAERHRRAMWAEIEPIEGLSGELAALIRRMESLVPENRPTAIDAAEMLSSIEERPRVVRRRRLVAVVWAVLILFGAGMTVQSFRVKKEAKRVEEEAATAREVSDFLIGLFEQASPQVTQGEEVTVRELLRRGVESIGEELREQPVVRARMLNTLGFVLYQMGLFDDAEPLLFEALDLRRKELPSGHAEVRESLRNCGRIAKELGRYDEAEALLGEALTTCAPVPVDQWPTSCVRVLIDVSSVDQDRGRWEEAEPKLRRAVDILEDRPDAVAVGLTDALFDLTVLYRKLHRYADAESMMLRCLELDRTEFGSESHQVAGDYSELCALAALQGRNEEAERHARRSLQIRTTMLGANHPQVAQSMTSVAFVLMQTGRPAEAAKLLQEAVRIYRHAYGDRHQYVASAMHSLGNAQRKTGNLERAVATLAEALAITEEIRGPEDRYTGETKLALGIAQMELGRFDIAEKLMTDALMISEKWYGADAVEHLDILDSLAECRRRQGRADEAAALELRMVAIRAGADGL